MTRPSFEDVVRRRYDRRSVLSGLTAGVSAALVPLFFGTRRAQAESSSATALGFASVPTSREDRLVVPPGYTAEVLLRWGDPLHAGGVAFDLGAQSGASQAARFGFNCDFLGFFPLRPGGSERGLLGVNHEFTRRRDMFPGARDKPSQAEIEVEMAAHGMSVAEVFAEPGGRWQLDLESRRNRRVTGATPIQLSGPVAGHELVQTSADPDGSTVLGTLYNCSGGVTPWDTMLSGEENILFYFANASRADDLRGRSQVAFGVSSDGSYYGWETLERRFDLAQEPNEFHRFGWVVELDPYDPEAAPTKRTALGRFAHEGATTALTDDRRVVVYSGDDREGECIYKFVSAGRYSVGDHAANRDLLDAGTLHVARFDADGTGRWLPLRPQGPLAEWSQAEILVHTRLAARALGATPMDRPEDIQVHPRTHRVYTVMTKNRSREHGDGAANPRSPNRHGHVIEIDEDHGDLGATTFTWNLFLLGGDPDVPEHGAYYAGAREGIDPLSCPDNLAFSPDGTLWIATDGQPKAAGSNDALYAVRTSGPERGRTRRFLTGPRGSEICGPEFTPDGRTLFVSVQHPGEGRGFDDPERGSTWPDGDFARPSVVAIRRQDGGAIGQ